MSELQVQYSTSTAWQSSVIRRLCHSPFSHVDIVIPGEGLLGASGEDKSLNDIGGVRIRSFEPWPYKIKETVTLDAPDAVIRAVIDKAKSQIGKPFDNEALWSFIGDPDGKIVRDWRDTAQWFCSELFIWSVEGGKFFPYPLVASKGRVSPADSLLLINPYMRSADIDRIVCLSEVAP